MTVESVERVYNVYARVYNFLFNRLLSGGREKAPSLLNFYEGAKLLEVGVGTGLTLSELPRDIEITGIDLSQGMLREAQKRIDKENWGHVDLRRMDAARMDLPDNSFDRVLAAYFVSVVPEPVEVLKEMKRVCRPGGIILVMNHFTHEVPVIDTIETVLAPLFYKVGFRTDLRLQPLFQEAELEIDRIVNIDFLGHWKAVRCVNRK
ncbi:MAG TPA: methyltransferase domain-containing protein [Acidobacteriota bacterium]|nr:methyltransferase domain-containing protein [Acidobacteriota bacterium]